MDAIDKKKLRAAAHALKPVILIGQSGLTEAVLAEIGQALNCHELIKIKIRAERDERAAIREQICTTTGSDLVQSIGQIAVIYRRNPKKTSAHAAKSAQHRRRVRLEKRTDLKAGQRR